MNMTHVTIRPIHNGFIALIALPLVGANPPPPKEMSFATLQECCDWLNTNGFKPLES